MDKRGGLERLACRLLRHLGRREPAEFVINERQKFFGSLGVALLDPVENASDLAHALEPKRSTRIAEDESLGVMTVRSAGAIPLHNSPRERCYGTIWLEALFGMGSHFLLTSS